MVAHVSPFLETNRVNCRYIFGITHVPRLEDWPVMPVERIGFMLMVIARFIIFKKVLLDFGLLAVIWFIILSCWI